MKVRNKRSHMLRPGGCWPPGAPAKIIHNTFGLSYTKENHTTTKNNKENQRKRKITRDPRSLPCDLICVLRLYAYGYGCRYCCGRYGRSNGLLGGVALLAGAALPTAGATTHTALVCHDPALVFHDPAPKCGRTHTSSPSS